MRIFKLHSNNFNTKATVNLYVSIVVDYRYTNMRISNFAIKYLRKNEQISSQDGMVQAKSNGSKVFNYITLLKLEQNKIFLSFFIKLFIIFLYSLSTDLGSVLL